MTRRPTTRSHNISDIDLRDYAARILKSMRKNATLFPQPTPELETLDHMIKAFTNAMADAAYRDRRAVLIRDAKRKELQEAIRYLAAYVHIIAKGNAELILASGFVPSKPGGSSNDIPLTESFQVIPTIGTAAIKLRVKAWRSARAYQFEYRKKGQNHPWTVVVSSKSSCVITNLEVLEEYEFRICYVGRNGKSPYSHPVASLVY